ncbi:hypothetical protein ACFLV7_11210 [Chloroflexota bacterium]
MENNRLINAKKLGDYLDGWADLIEGMGSVAEDVQTELLKQLNERDMPEVKVESVMLKPNTDSKDRRSYLITTRMPGATTTIYTGKHGNDLFTAWRTYIKAPINRDVFINSAAIPFMLMIIGAIVLILLEISYPKLFNLLVSSFKAQVTESSFLFLVSAIPLIIFIFIAYKIKPTIFSSNEWLGCVLGPILFLVFLISIIFSINTDITEKSMSAWESLFDYLISIINTIIPSDSRILGAFIGNYLTILFFVALFGFFTKLNFLYYFKIHPTLFDEEDITAMSLTVHKSLLRALDNSGIDISKLRIKQSFKGGQKDHEL